MLNFPFQRLKIRLQQRALPPDRLADEAAVGAAGGTEGNADIEGDVAGAQTLRGPQRGKGAFDAEPPAGGRDMIGLFHQPVGRLLRAAGQQMPRGELCRPDAGQAAPLRGRAQARGGGVIGVLQQTAAGGDVRLLQLHAAAGPRRDAVQGDAGRGGEPALSGVQRGNGAVAGKGLSGRLHRLVGKQRELQLLDRVAVVVTD